MEYFFDAGPQIDYRLKKAKLEFEIKIQMDSLV